MRDFLTFSDTFSWFLLAVSSPDSVLGELKELKQVIQELKGLKQDIQELKGLKQDIQDVKAKLKTVEKQMRFVPNIDPWGSLTTQTSLGSKNDLRQALMNHYDYKQGDKVKCMVTGVEDDTHGDQRERVVAAHLFPRSRKEMFVSWQDTIKQTVCESIDHALNGMFLLKDIEIAYDKQRICFLCNALDLSIRLKVLDPQIKTQCPTRCDKTFEDLEAVIIKDPTITYMKRPSFRILSCHAQCALDEAESRGWLDSAEKDGLESIIQLCSPARPQ